MGWNSSENHSFRKVWSASDMGLCRPVLLILGLFFMSTANRDPTIVGAMPTVKQKRILHTGSLQLSASCRWFDRDAFLLDETPTFFCLIDTFSNKVWMYSLRVSQDGIDQKLLKISVLSSSLSSSQLCFFDHKQCCDVQGGPMIFGCLFCPVAFL